MKYRVEKNTLEDVDMKKSILKALSLLLCAVVLCAVKTGDGSLSSLSKTSQELHLKVL